MTPHLVKWNDTYQAQGLRVVEIDNGDRDSLADLEAHIEEAGVRFPVLHDVGGEVCRRFGISGYPSSYLVGRDGKVIWGGYPMNKSEIERKIESAL